MARRAADDTATTKLRGIMHLIDAAKGRPTVTLLGEGSRLLGALEQRAAAAGARLVRLETNRVLEEAIAMYRRSGYREVAPFNAEPYAHHWFEKPLRDD